jgi:hypothetical protein
VRRLALLIPLALLACDSGDDPSDAERFVGNWTVERVAIDPDDPESAELTGPGGVFERVAVRFRDDGSVAFTLVYPGLADAQTISGTYRVDEAVGVVAFALRVPGVASTVPVGSDYAFEDDALRLRFPPAVLNLAMLSALGPATPALSDDVALSLTR